MSCWAASFRVPLVYPTLRKNERIAAPGVSQIRFQLFLSRAHPRCVVLLGNSHALVAQQNRDSFDWNSSKKQFNSERVAEAVRMSIRNVCEFEEFAPRFAKSGAFGTGSWTDTSPPNGCRIATKVAIWELAENRAAYSKPLHTERGTATFGSRMGTC